MNLRQYFYSGFIFIISLLVIGCATTTPPQVPLAAPTTIEGVTGIYHRTQKGETLWRIAKTYHVDLDELVRLNKISDATKIDTGQPIFIPLARKQENTLPLQNSAYEDFVWPLKGRVICEFGRKIDNIISKGIDIQAPYGQDVVASRSGVVSFCDERLKSFGKTVIIDHGDGFLTVYARNSDIFVKKGDRVSQGMVIAKVGCAGKNRASFLHFEIRKGHIPKNPYYYLPN